MDARVETIAHGKCLRCGSESHNLQACTRPRRQQSSRSDSVKPASKKTYAKPKGKAADTQGSNTGSQEKKKSKGKSRGKGSQTKPTAKGGDVDFFEDPHQADPDDQDEERAHDELQEDDPEAYVIAAATSSFESDVESDGMLDWYKVGIATVAALLQSQHRHKRIRANGVDLVVYSEYIDNYEDVCLHLLVRKTSGKASPYSLN